MVDPKAVATGVTTWIVIGALGGLGGLIGLAVGGFSGAPWWLQVPLLLLSAFCIYCAGLLLWPYRPQRGPKYLGVRREDGMDWEGIRLRDGSIQVFGPRCPTDADGLVWNDINGLHAQRVLTDDMDLGFGHWLSCPTCGSRFPEKNPLEVHKLGSVRAGVVQQFAAGLPSNAKPPPKRWTVV